MVATSFMFRRFQAYWSVGDNLSGKIRLPPLFGQVSRLTLQGLPVSGSLNLRLVSSLCLSLGLGFDVPERLLGHGSLIKPIG